MEVAGRRKQRMEWLIYAVFAFACVGLSIWLAGNYGLRKAVQDLRRQANGTVALDVAVLRSELEKQRALPFVLSRDPDVLACLTAPDPSHVAAMNAKLETLNQGTRSAVIYLIDRAGLTIASSNWREPISFVGSNYRFRPYFTGAVSDGHTEHFALGTVSQRPGLYIARRIEGPGGFLGVVVVKVEFFNVEADWHQSGATVYVTDPRGIVLLTSRPDWRFMAQNPIAPAEAERIRTSLQFGDAALKPLPLRHDTGKISGTDLITIPGVGPHLASESDVPTTDWRLHLLAPAGATLSAGVAAMRASALAGAGLAFVLIGVLLYRRHRALSRTAELKETQAELERRVVERTHDLGQSNALLSAEIDERLKIEAKLQAARDELAQANRLALLGQITAGLAHEVNQPVAAIRSFADNAVVLLERNAPADARANMATIAALTEKIADIIAELRRFSRKATGAMGPVSLREALDGARLLMGIRARRQNAALAWPDVEAGLAVIANRVRLEQVLVNLLQNALEAMEGREDQAIEIEVACSHAAVTVTIADNGPGVTPEVMAHLFTPFTTTKPKGLGLGLVISKDIVEEFGGRLEARSVPGQGSRFLITLKAAA